MKHSVLFSLVALGAVFLNLSREAGAQGIFGNSPMEGTAFSFVSGGGGVAGGGAVAFTPMRDFSFSSITLWLTGYTGLDMYGNMTQSFYAFITDDYARQTGDNTYQHQPGSETVASLSVPAPNDGATAAFTFANLSPTAVLHADTTYWLFIYESTGGVPNWGHVPEWVSGDAPAGDAVYNGASSFYAGMFASSYATPAFTITAVPEPGVTTILVLGLLAVLTSVARHQLGRKSGIDVGRRRQLSTSPAPTPVWVRQS